MGADDGHGTLGAGRLSLTQKYRILESPLQSMIVINTIQQFGADPLRSSALCPLFGALGASALGRRRFTHFVIFRPLTPSTPLFFLIVANGTVYIGSNDSNHGVQLPQYLWRV